jgi:hypothetical protein
VTIVRVKGFKIYRDCRQKMRCYHRKTGEPVDLEKNPIGFAGFFAECARISAFAEARVAEREKSGTLGALLCNYRKSSAFRDDLAPRTQVDYNKVFDYLRPIADTPLVRFNRPLVVRIRDKAAETKGKRFGNYVKAGLSIIFTWGCERGFLENNPASRIKDLRRKKGAPEANRPWADRERYAVLEEAPAHFRPVIAFPPGHCLDDVHGARPERGRYIAEELREGWRNRDKAIKDRRAGFLAHTGRAGGHSRQGPISCRHNALRQFQRPPMVAEWP